jgi:hypothetical protein
VLAPGAPASVLTRRSGTVPTFWVNRRDACQQAWARPRRCVQLEGALSLKNALRSKFRLATHARPRGRQRPPPPRFPRGNHSPSLTLSGDKFRCTAAPAAPATPPLPLPVAHSGGEPRPWQGLQPAQVQPAPAPELLRHEGSEASEDAPPVDASDSSESARSSPRASRPAPRCATRPRSRQRAGARHCSHGPGARVGRGRGAGSEDRGDRRTERVSFMW